MAKQSSFKLNVVANVIIKLLGAIVPLILSPIVARALLPTGLGNFSYAHSIVSYFSLAVTFGFLNYGTKKIAENRKNEKESSFIFWKITYAKLFLFIVTSIVYFAMIFIFDLTKGFDNAIFIAMFLMIVGSFFDVTYYFQGMEKMLGFSIVNLAVNVIYTIAVILFVKNTNDLLIYTIFKSSITLLTSLVSVFLIDKNIKSVPKFEFKEVFSSLKSALPFFIPTLILTITPTIDQTMLGSLSTTAEVGYYEEANKIITIVLIVATAVSSILLSRVAYLRSDNDEKTAIEKIESSIKNVLFVVIPSIFGIYCISDIFFVTYFGDEFATSANVMYWLAPCILFSSLITIVLFGYYYAKGETKTATIIVLICDLLNVVMNIFAIKWFGARGAAFTSSFTNGLLLILCIIFSYKKINYKTIVSSSIKQLFASILMALVVIMVKNMLQQTQMNNILVLILVIFVGGFTYLFACYATNDPIIMAFVGMIKKALKLKKEKKSKC